MALWDATSRFLEDLKKKATAFVQPIVQKFQPSPQVSRPFTPQQQASIQQSIGKQPVFTQPKPAPFAPIPTYRAPISIQTTPISLNAPARPMAVSKPSQPSLTSGLAGAAQRFVEPYKQTFQAGLGRIDELIKGATPKLLNVGAAVQPAIQQMTGLTPSTFRSPQAAVRYFTGEPDIRTPTYNMTSQVSVDPYAIPGQPLGLGEAGAQFMFRGANVPLGIAPLAEQAYLRTAGAIQQAGKTLPKVNIALGQAGKIALGPKIAPKVTPKVAAKKEAPQLFKGTKELPQVPRTVPLPSPTEGVLPSPTEGVLPSRVQKGLKIVKPTVEIPPVKPTIKPPVKTEQVVEELIPPAVPPIKPPIKLPVIPIVKQKFAGNINLEKIDAPDEVKDIIRRTADENADLIEAQRRGVVHTKEIVAENIAAKTGMTAERFMNTPAGKAMNAEELATLDAFMVRKIANVQKLADDIRNGNLTPQTQLQFYKELNEAIQLEAVAAGGRAEAGRSLQSLKNLRDAMDMDVLNMNRVVEALGGREMTEELASKIAMLDFGNPAEVFNFLRSIYKPNLRQYIDSLFFNSILSGPSTHLINSISNTVFALVNNVLVRPVRAGIDIPIAALQGRQREYYMREVIPALTGMVEGSIQGLRRAIEFMLRGYDTMDIAGASKIERLFRVEPFRGPLSFINVPSRALRAADLFFKSVNYNAELAAGAARQAAKEGLEGEKFAEKMAELLKNPSQKMLKEAGEFADYVTFTTKPDKVTSYVIGIRDKLPTSEFIIPFISTPSNLVKRGFEFSPVGFGLTIGKQGAQVSDQLAKAIVGSSIAGTLAAMFWSGGITGAAPKSPAARDEFYRQGKQPYSINMGGTWVQFQRLEPLNTSLSMIAAVYDAFVNNGEVPTLEKTMIIAGGIGENIVSQTWLRGVANILDALKQTGRFLPKLAAGVATGFIPTFVAQMARATDEYIRQPENFQEKIMERIPGLREAVPPKMDVFGRPIETRGFAGELFPIKFSKESTDPVEAELGRLDVNIGFPTNKITTPGKKEIELTRDGQYIYTQLAGQAIKARMDRALQNPDWQTLTDEQKGKVVQKIAREERESVRGVMLKLTQKEYEGQAVTIQAINDRLREIGSEFQITELPTTGPLNLIENIDEQPFEPTAPPTTQRPTLLGQIGKTIERVNPLNPPAAYASEAPSETLFTPGRQIITNSPLGRMGVPPQYSGVIEQAAKSHGVPPEILAAIAKHESAGTFNPNINEYSGGMGRGIFQIDLSQHPGVTEAQAKDPIFAANYAAVLLADGFRRFGNWRDAIKAYNAGPNFNSYRRGYNGMPVYLLASRYYNSVRSLIPGGVI